MDGTRSFGVPLYAQHPVTWSTSQGQSPLTDALTSSRGFELDTGIAVDATLRSLTLPRIGDVLVFSNVPIIPDTAETPDSTASPASMRADDASPDPSRKPSARSHSASPSPARSSASAQGRRRSELPTPVPDLNKRSRGRHVPSAPTPRRTYTCEAVKCGKTFVRREHLRRHMLSLHTHERPFPCVFPGCNKFFTRHDNLLQHEKIHQGGVATPPPPKKARRS